MLRWKSGFKKLAFVLLADHERVRIKAISNVGVMRRADTRGGSSRYLNEWERLVNGDLDALVEAMLDPSSDATDLRRL